MMLFDRITKKELYQIIDAYQTQLQNAFHENTALEGRVLDLEAENKRLCAERSEMKAQLFDERAKIPEIAQLKQERDELFKANGKLKEWLDLAVSENSELREKLADLEPVHDGCCSCGECHCCHEPEEYDPDAEAELEEELEYEAALDECAERIDALEKFVNEFGEDCTPEPCKLTCEELEEQVENLQHQCSEYFYKAVEADTKAAKWEQMCKELVCGFMDITVNGN